MFEFIANTLFGTGFTILGVLLFVAILLIAALVVVSILSTLMEVPIVAMFLFPVVGQLFWGTFGIIAGIVLFVIMLIFRIKRGQ